MDAAVAAIGVQTMPSHASYACLSRAVDWQIGQYVAMQLVWDRAFMKRCTVGAVFVKA